MNRTLRVTRRTALVSGAAGAVSGLFLRGADVGPREVLAAPEARPTNLPIARARIERALGKVGQMESNGVLHFSLDRQDIHPKTEGVEIVGSFFLGTEVFFKQYRAMTMAMVEIPLVGEEVNPSIQRAFDARLMVTALHNHRIMMNRQVWWLHLMGMGNGAALASGIRQVLPGAGSKFASGAPSKATTPLNAKTIGTVLGGKTQVNDGGVVEVTVERTDTVTMSGVQVPSSFGISHDIYFKPINGSSSRAACTAELALAQGEVEPVARLLRREGFQIAALHNHMINEHPRRFFLHLWAVGDAVTMAGAIRNALNLTRSEGSHGGGGRG